MTDPQPTQDAAALVGSLRARVSHLDQAVTLRARALRSTSGAAGQASGDDRVLMSVMVGAQGVIVLLALVAGALWIGKQRPPELPPVDPLVAVADPAVAVPVEPSAPADAEPPAPAVSGEVPTPDPVAAEPPSDDAVDDGVAAAQQPPPEPGAPRIAHTFERFPGRISGDTRAATARFADTYSCAPGKREHGAEVWYRVVVPQRGFLTAWIEGDRRGVVDVDVHLLAEADPASCLRRGDTGVAATLDPGTYWLVVDTFSGRSDLQRPGPYELGVTFAPR